MPMSSTNRGSERARHDYYPTPVSAIKPMLLQFDREKLRKASVLEPCVGDGSILDRVPAKTKVGIDIQTGTDYLSYCPQQRFDVIMTNPPFSIALPFLRKSLSEADTVVYLLRVNFLGSKKRKRFWQANPPTHLFVLSARPSFTGGGTDSTEYAWFAWDRCLYLTKPPGVYVL